MKLRTLFVTLCSLMALNGCTAQAGGDAEGESAESTEALCANPNLLANPSFQNVGPNGSSTTVTTAVPGGAGNSAAANWTLFTSTPGTIRTNLMPSSRGDGSNMIHVYNLTGPRNGLVQVFGAFNSGPTHVIGGAWVYVVKGQVGIGVGNGGNTSLTAFTTQTGVWQYLRTGNSAIPANEMAIYGTAAGVNEFYVDAASVQNSPPLLTNGNFATVGPNGSSTNATTFVAGGAGNSAAANWTLFTNTPGNIKTQVVPSAITPGANMIKVQTNGWRNGLVQVFGGAKSCTVNGPAKTRARGQLYIHSGTVGVGTGNGGNTQLDKVLTTTGQWLSFDVPNGVSPANEFIIYSASVGGASFDVAWADVYEVP